MASICLEFPGGAFRHIPAGSYYEQTSTWIGEVEMELIRVVHSVWYAFKYLDLSKWTEEQGKLAMWMNSKPEPGETRHIDAVIATLWRVSDWAMEVTENMRSYA